MTFIVPQITVAKKLRFTFQGQETASNRRNPLDPANLSNQSVVLHSARNRSVGTKIVIRSSERNDGLSARPMFSILWNCPCKSRHSADLPEGVLRKTVSTVLRYWVWAALPNIGR